MSERIDHIKLLLITLVLIFSCTEKKETFRFVQLCDTQLGMGGYEHDKHTFELAVKRINELNPDFVTICGDLVNIASDSSYSDFMAIKEEFNMPCHLAPGNHDVGNNPTDTTLQYYRETIGEDYFYFHNKGYNFVIINTQLWKVDVQNESANHDDWFKETLQSLGSEGSPIFIIGHYPLYTKVPDENEHYYNLPINKRHEILKLLSQNNVVAYLSGHTHKTVINQYQNIQFVSGETTSKNFDGRALGFRIWEVSPDSIVHNFMPIE